MKIDTFDFVIPHVKSPYKTSIDERLIFYIILPYINFPCKTSIGWQAVFRLSPCDNFDYHMHDFDAHTVRLREETLITLQWQIHV